MDLSQEQIGALAIIANRELAKQPILDALAIAQSELDIIEAQYYCAVDLVNNDFAADRTNKIITIGLLKNQLVELGS